MKRKMHKNSLIAWDTIKDNLKGRKLQVLEAIKSNGGKATSLEVSNIIGVELHKISGRFGELSTDGYILDSGNKNGYTVWSLSDNIYYTDNTDKNKDLQTTIF